MALNILFNLQIGKRYLAVCPHWVVGASSQPAKIVVVRNREIAVEQVGRLRPDCLLAERKERRILQAGGVLKSGEQSINADKRPED